MADGVRAWSNNGSATGAVVFNAGDDIAVSRITADGDIRLTAKGGAIRDVLSGDGFNLDGDAAAVELLAASGIGSGNALITRVATLAATNTAGGGIAIHEATSLVLAGSGAFALESAGANGAVSVSAGGVLTLQDAVRTTGAGGNLLLEGDAGLAIRGDITAGLGSVKLASGGNIVLNNGTATGPRIMASNAGQTIALAAGGDVAFAANALLSTKNGNVTVDAGGAVALGIITAGSGQAGVKAGTVITDAQDDDSANALVNVTAGSLVLQAGGAAGSSGHLIETQVATLAARVGGVLAVQEKDGLALGAITAASLDLRVGGSLALDGAVGVGGDLVLQAQGAITQGAAGKLAASNGTISVTSTQGTIAMADGASAATNGGAIRLAAAGNITLGLLDARSDAARGAASLAGQSGWGAVSVVAGGSILTAGTQGTQLFASGVQLQAANAVGSGGNAVRTEAARVSAHAGAGGVYIADASDVVLESLASGGNAVLGAAGNLVVGGNVTASGNLLLQAAGGALVIGSLEASGTVSLVAADIAGADGNGVDIRAAALQMTATGSIGSSGNALHVAAAKVAAQAGGNLFLAADGNVAFEATRAGGSIVLAASGDVAIASMAAGDIQVTAGGSIVGNPGGTNLAANAATLNAATAIGSGSQHLEVQVARLSATAGNGGIFVDTHGGVNVEAAQAMAGHVVLVADAGGMTIGGKVDSGANVLLASAGNLVLDGNVAGRQVSLQAGGALTQRGDVDAGAGSVVIGAASVAMADGAVTRGAAIRVAAGGDITLGLLDAGTGSASVAAGGRILDAQAAGALQTPNVKAGALRLSAGGDIGTSDNALEIAVDTLGAFSAAGGISVRELDGLRITATGVGIEVARVQADGSAIALSDAALAGVSAAGEVRLETLHGSIAMEHGYLAPAGKDTWLSGDAIGATAALQGQGGALLIQPGDGLLDIQLGGAAAEAGSMFLSADTIGHVDGFGQVVIGSGLPGQDVHVAGTGSPVVFHDALVLNASGNGSVIHIEGALGAEGLQARGAVEIAGGVILATGNGAAAGGDLVFKDSIDGAPGSVNDLTLAAGGDSVTVAGSIGSVQPLHSLTIRDAANVTFNQAVTVDGDLVIHATGVVRFDAPVTLNGGTLTIDGASQVIIGDIVVHGQNGPLVLQSDTLTLQGTISGAGTVVLTTVDPTRGIEVGTGAGGAGTLNIDLATLARLATATELVFGSEGMSGKVRIGAIDLSAITAAPVTVHGGLVEVQAGSGVLRTGAALVLDGRSGVLVGDDIVAGGAVAIGSGAGVTMAAGTHVSGSGRIDVVAQGTISIGQLTADLVVVDGATLQGNGDTAANIVARQVSLHGYGPLAGQGNALVLDAPIVHVAAMSGMVVQDTDPDGRTHFNLLDGGKMYEQAVALGSVERVTADPAAPAGSPAYAFGSRAQVESMASLLGDSGWGSAWAASAATSGYLSGNGVANGAATGAELGMLSSSSLGLTRLFGQSFALGSAGQQALSTGQPASGTVDFDYWLEDLVV
jgi:hypothetical protein